MSLQLNLFEGPAPGSQPSAAPCPRPELVRRPGLRLRFWPGWLSEAEAFAARVRGEVPWQQESITLWGRTHPLPRLTCWMGDPGCAYTYSGVRNRIEPWTPAVQRLKGRVEAEIGVRFNSLLLNRYRNGRDRLHWHADDEPELDPWAPIASLSLGSSRSFRLRPRQCRAGDLAPLAFELGMGDLLVMDPPTQAHWQHQVPRRLRIEDERINLTFRVVRQG